MTRKGLDKSVDGLVAQIITAFGLDAGNKDDMLFAQGKLYEVFRTKGAKIVAIANGQAPAETADAAA